MFKILVLQQLNNLSDDQIEYQIRDGLSFMRFLGLQIESRVPDAKTIWLFREELVCPRGDSELAVETRIPPPCLYSSSWVELVASGNWSSLGRLS